MDCFSIFSKEKTNLQSEKNVTFRPQRDSNPHTCVQTLWNKNTLPFVCISKSKLRERKILSITPIWNKSASRTARPCQRSYHVENTGSRPITEVKQHRARLVLRWVTAWERRVSLAFLLFCTMKLSVFLDNNGLFFNI